MKQETLDQLRMELVKRIVTVPAEMRERVLEIAVLAMVVGGNMKRSQKGAQE